MTQERKWWHPDPGPHTLSFRGGALMFLFYPGVDRVTITTPLGAAQCDIDELERDIVAAREKRLAADPAEASG